MAYYETLSSTVVPHEIRPSWPRTALRVDCVLVAHVNPHLIRTSCNRSVVESSKVQGWIAPGEGSGQQESPLATHLYRTLDMSLCTPHVYFPSKKYILASPSSSTPIPMYGRGVMLHNLIYGFFFCTHVSLEMLPTEAQMVAPALPWSNINIEHWDKW